MEAFIEEKFSLEDIFPLHIINCVMTSRPQKTSVTLPPVETSNMIFQEHRFSCAFSASDSIVSAARWKNIFPASPEKSFRSDWSCNWQMAKDVRFHMLKAFHSAEKPKNTRAIRCSSLKAKFTSRLEERLLSRWMFSLSADVLFVIAIHSFVNYSLGSAAWRFIFR